MGGKEPCYVGKAVIAQTSEEPRDADDTTRHMPLVLDADVCDNLLHHIRLAVVGHNTQRQRQEVRRHRIITIIYRVGIEHMTRTQTCASLDGQEVFVECRRHLLADRSPIARLTAPLLHQLQGADDICGGDERDVRLARIVL